MNKGAFRYTVSGSPAFEERLTQIMSEIRLSFEEKLDSSRIKALILGGGYGRGEGGALQTEEGEKLYNDLDFFVIGSSMPLWQKRRIEASLAELHHELSKRYEIDVDFSPVQSLESLPGMKPQLMWYDLKQGHRVILGKDDILKYLPPWSSADLPLMEAYRLLLNRGVGLYLAKKRLESFDLGAADFVNRNIHKAYLGLGDAILIAEGRYQSSALKRQEHYASTNLSKYSRASALEERLAEAVDFKLQPELCTQDAAELSARVREALLIFKKVYYSLWSLSFGFRVSEYRGYLAGLMSKPPTGASAIGLLKNFLLNTRDTGFKSFNLDLFSSYPRLRLFAAFPWLLLGEKQDAAFISQILGVTPTQDEGLLRQRFMMLWTRYN